MHDHVGKEKLIVFINNRKKSNEQCDYCGGFRVIPTAPSAAFFATANNSSHMLHLCIHAQYQLIWLYGGDVRPCSARSHWLLYHTKFAILPSVGTMNGQAGMRHKPSCAGYRLWRC